MVLLKLKGGRDMAPVRQRPDELHQSLVDPDSVAGRRSIQIKERDSFPTSTDIQKRTLIS